MDLQEHALNIIQICSDSKEQIVRAISKTCKVIDACDESINEGSNIDKFKYLIAVKTSCSELNDELMRLAGSYDSLRNSTIAIKKAYNEYSFNDENSYMSKYNDEFRRRQLAENRLSAVKEMYGAKDVKEKLIEYQKYHNVKL